ncbi:FAD-dependent oxidoreductase [Micromonospora tarapacensis]|uniref:FAD-dependent oxidoreductase n=1 Tax=Micromonospora tarapacensis TaxID=2835305 RepID=UPI001E36CED2|nr:FAD-dependent oxidoreductase [Micromonospora tarapacensis]
MAVHLIVGAGMVGATTARQLAERGEQVRIVSRSGRGPNHPGSGGSPSTPPTPTGSANSRRA